MRPTRDGRARLDHHDDEHDAPDATPSASTTPPTNDTPSPTAEPAQHVNATPAPAGVVLLNGTFDDSTGAALVPLQAQQKFDVPAGLAHLRVNFTFETHGSAQPTDRDRTVGLVAPGDAIAPGTTSANAVTSSSISEPATAGTWTPPFDGQGPALARFEARGYTAAEWSALGGT